MKKHFGIFILSVLLLCFVLSVCGCDNSPTPENPDNGEQTCDHLFGNWDVFSGSSCENIVYKRVCSKCQAEELKNGSEADHVWGETETFNSTCIKKGYSKKICTKCLKVEIFDMAETLGGHSWGYTSVFEPTCTSEGFKVRYCSVCKQEEIFDRTGVLGDHTWEYSFDSDYHWTQCSTCDTVSEKESHALVDDLYCSICNYYNNPLAGTYYITMWVSELPGVADLFQQQIDAFEAANPGIKINVAINSVTEADAGSQVICDPLTAPDLFCFAQYDLARLVQANALAAPSKTIADELKASNDKGAVSAASVAGTMYAYPMTSDNGYYMYYDKSIITNPESLEDIIADVEAYNAAHPDSHKWIRFALENGWYNSSFFFATGCHSLWTMDEYGNFTSVDDTFNSPEGLIAMKGMQKLVQSSAYNSDADIYTDTAVWITGVWNSYTAEDYFGENFAATDLPSFTVDGKEYHLGSFSGNKLIGVNATHTSDAKKAEVLSLLAQFLTNEQCQLERYNEFQWGPSNLKAQASDEVQSNPSLAALAKQGNYAIPQGQIPGSWWDIARVLGEDVKWATSDTELQWTLDNYTMNINGILNIDEEQKMAWSVIGSISGTNWDADFAMTEVSEGVWESVVIELTLTSRLLLRRGASWDVHIGADGQMWTPSITPANIVPGLEGRYIVRLIWDGVSDKAIVEFVPVT